MALRPDPFRRFTNIRWASDAFLYSGEDGMHGSSDGETWEAAPSSVPARSLACVDGVWVACSFLVGAWRSSDGARTWASTGSKFEQVVAFKPAGVDDQGKRKRGVFVAWAEDAGGENQDIYASFDLGRSWSVVNSIPRTIGSGSAFDRGYELVRCLSGCGERAFISTVRNEGGLARDAGHIYSTADGSSFSGGMVFGPGAAGEGYTAGGVGFDGEQYMACGLREHVASSVRTTTLRYTQSSSGSFSPGEGTEFAEASTPETLLIPFSVAGGEGRFATGSVLVDVTSGATQGQAYFLPDGSVTDLGAAQFVNHFCKKRVGPFGCAVYTGSSHVFIARPGDTWRSTLSGSGQPALAVGRIGF